jgi:hypothetical protein
MRHRRYRRRRDPTSEQDYLLKKWVDLQFGTGEVEFKAVRGKGKWLLLLKPLTKRNQDLAFVMVSDEELEYAVPPRGRKSIEPESREKIVRRVHKLLRLAEGNANPNEERAARKAARQLIAKHGLSFKDLSLP